MRAQVEKKMAQKEKEKKEEKLRELAQMARDRRAGIKSHGDKGERFLCWPFQNVCTSLLVHRFISPSLFHRRLLSRVSQLTSPSLSLLPPPPSFPSVCIHLGRQVAAAATTATSESATRSATTDGKSDSTTGTFPGPLLIRGAGHATLNTPHVNSATVSSQTHVHAHTHTPTNGQTLAACRCIIHGGCRMQPTAQEASPVCLCMCAVCNCACVSTLKSSVGGAAGLWRCRDPHVLQLPLRLSNLVISKLTFTSVWPSAKRTAEMSVTECCQRKIFLLYCRTNTSAQLRYLTAASGGSRDFGSCSTRVSPQIVLASSTFFFDITSNMQVETVAAL